MLQATKPELLSVRKLLTADDPAPFEVVNRGGGSRAVLLCEHSGRIVPKALGDLGIVSGEFDRHIAYDIGADGVSRRLSALLDAPLVLQPFSRLVVDCNRDLDAPDCIPEVSDGTAIPANVALPPENRLARYHDIHMPFHNEVATLLDASSDPAATVLVTIHSFTPRLATAGHDRPWEIGLLYIRDDRFARRLMQAMTGLRPGLCAAFNEPYAGNDLTDYAIPVHGERRGIEHVLIEIRNDLIGDDAGQAEWAGFLAAAIRQAMSTGPD